MERPRPPEEVFYLSPAFLPAEGMDAFVRGTFLDPESPLFIQEHEILEQADIGYLWAGPAARDKNRMILGTAQQIRPPQKKWSSLRSFYQVEEWFGPIDFLITLSAPYCADRETTDAEFLALLDHELSHCVQEERNGIPQFSHDTGRPLWAVRGHDVEQFVGVVERWGAEATGVTELVAAASRAPRFEGADIQRILNGCGTCLRAA